MNTSSINLESEFENAVNAVRNAFNNKVKIKIKNKKILNLLNIYIYIYI